MNSKRNYNKSQRKKQRLRERRGLRELDALVEESRIDPETVDGQMRYDLTYIIPDAPKHYKETPKSYCVVS